MQSRVNGRRLAGAIATAIAADNAAAKNGNGKNGNGKAAPVVTRTQGHLVPNGDGLALSLLVPLGKARLSQSEKSLVHYACPAYGGFETVEAEIDGQPVTIKLLVITPLPKEKKARK